jgi:hypothetical protein
LTCDLRIWREGAKDDSCKIVLPGFCVLMDSRKEASREQLYGVTLKKHLG